MLVRARTSLSVYFTRQEVRMLVDNENFDNFAHALVRYFEGKEEPYASQLAKLANETARLVRLEMDGVLQHIESIVWTAGDRAFYGASC